MIDRAHQDANFESDVVLTGLVPQLTTPSRDHGDLVDIWFGVQWRERSAEWEESFARLANEWRPDPRSPSYFDLFSYAANSGLDRGAPGQSRRDGLAPGRRAGASARRPE